MKKLFIGVLSLILVLSFTGIVVAQDAATKDEVVAKCKEAVKIGQEKGVEEALKAIKAEGSPFVWKDTYIFAIDFEKQTVVAHPVTPGLEGKNLMGLKDVNGKLFFAEFINLAKEKGEGWVDYMWPKPGEKTPSPKESYILRIPDTTVFVLAGIYP